MNDEQLLRYSRHILLTQLGIEAQERFLASRALVLGAGGLGAPALLYLAASGVGKITVCDGEEVDLTNLQRQIVHGTSSIGKAKTLSAVDTLARINPEVEVVGVARRVAGEELDALVRDADVVLDCSDNFPTRHAVNRACVRHKRPLVSGAAIRFDGQIAVFDLRREDSACYHCLFPQDDDLEDVPCAVMGVFAPLTGVVGTMQAAEALKILADAGETLNGRLLLFDALNCEWREVKLNKDPRCPVCSRGS